MAMRTVLLMLASAAGALALAAGCSSSPPKTDDSDSTTRALNDPMNYSPQDEDDISGGGVTEFHGDAFKKDMNHVLNP